MLGPGANYRSKVKKSESFLETSMTARPITVEKPLKAKQRNRYAANNGRTKNETPLSSGGEQPSNEMIVEDGEQYNERKISHSGTKGSENEEVGRHNSEPCQRSSSSEKSRKLEHILQMSNVATDVDSGEPVFVEHEEKRGKQMPSRHYSADGKPPLRSQRYISFSVKKLNTVAKKN